MTASRLSFRLLCGLLAWALATAAGAQLPRLPWATAPASASAPAPAPAAADGARSPAARIEDELADARRTAVRLQAMASDGEPLLEERRQAANRLVALLELRQLRAGAAADAAPPPEAPALAGAPPFPIEEVDRLRDQRDALAAQRTSLQLSVKSLDDEIDGLVHASRRADETLRLRQEQRERADRNDALAERDAQLALARMESRIATLEAALADEHRAASRARLQRIGATVEALDREIERARSAQRLDEAVLEQTSKAAEQERQRIARLRARLSARLAAREARGIGADTAASREADALRGALAALAELDLLEQGRPQVWRLREAALAAGHDPERRRAAGAAIGDALAQIEARLPGANEQLEFARAMVRVQRGRLESSAEADGASRQAEQQAVEAAETQLDARERVRETAARLAVLLSRSQDDLGTAGRPGSARDWLARGAAALAALGRSAWEYELFSASETTQVDGRPVTVEYGVTVGKSVGALVLFAIGYWIAVRLTRRLIALAVSRAGISAQLARVLQRWLMSALVLLVLLLVLRTARVPLTAFAFLGGALAIGVGFGAQNVIKNLISGVIILFERKVRVGDIVTIGGVSGTVVAVDLRATTVRGFDGIESFVPNSNLLENLVSNWTYQNTMARRVVAVGVAYGADVRRAAGILLECARAHPAVLQEPAPEVLFDDFGADALQLKLQFWVHQVGVPGAPSVSSDLRFAIDDAFRTEGIPMPFRQVDVHLDAATPIEVALRRGG